jgi:hypothetical protein
MTIQETCCRDGVSGSALSPALAGTAPLRATRPATGGLFAAEPAVLTAR